MSSHLNIIIQLVQILENKIGQDWRLKNQIANSITHIYKQWDTAGQERFKALTNNYYRDAHGIVVVYDVTERSTFDAIDSWMEDIEKYGQRSVCKLLVGNKADWEQKKKISKEEGEFKAKQFNSLFLETSAKTAENVQKIFQLICQKILELRKDPNRSPPRNAMNNNNLKRKDNQQKGCC